MKKTKNKDGESFLDRAKEIGKKYGVEVKDGSELGIRGIGIVGGVRRQDQESGAKRPFSKSPPSGGEKRK
jgi:hypothetical protein